MVANDAGVEQFTIHDLATRLKVSEKTLKKWEREKKIPEARRSPFAWRLYTIQEIDEIEKLVKDNGFFVKHKREKQEVSRDL
ncbi:MAG TPA: MerR family transcriptional regulator [Candidatus Acidoferrales bacterium]|jgi:DNA-binding transcriptional MerR regulator|nr:MerR family transcriptional regulator [Candidatus Acidoferrales bacterium]